MQIKNEYNIYEKKNKKVMLNFLFYFITNLSSNKARINVKPIII